jgi:hypothetical protein
MRVNDLEGRATQENMSGFWRRMGLLGHIDHQLLAKNA